MAEIHLLLLVPCVENNLSSPLLFTDGPSLPLLSSTWLGGVWHKQTTFWALRTEIWLSFSPNNSEWFFFCCFFFWKDSKFRKLLRWTTRCYHVVFHAFAPSLTIQKALQGQMDRSIVALKKWDRFNYCSCCGRGGEEGSWRSSGGQKG